MSETQKLTQAGGAAIDRDGERFNSESRDLINSRVRRAPAIAALAIAKRQASGNTASTNAGSTSGSSTSSSGSDTSSSGSATSTSGSGSVPASGGSVSVSNGGTSGGGNSPQAGNGGTSGGNSPQAGNGGTSGGSTPQTGNGGTAGVSNGGTGTAAPNGDNTGTTGTSTTSTTTEPSQYPYGTFDQSHPCKNDQPNVLPNGQPTICTVEGGVPTSDACRSSCNLLLNTANSGSRTRRRLEGMKS